MRWALVSAEPKADKVPTDPQPGLHDAHGPTLLSTPPGALTAGQPCTNCTGASNTLSSQSIQASHEPAQYREHWPIESSQSIQASMAQQHLQGCDKDAEARDPMDLHFPWAYAPPL